MRLAVIPARGGSKRIPGKNVKAFRGKPMIGYAVSAALASGVFDKVVVSTDDEQISAIATSLGADVPFQRPADIADDHTPTVPVIAHAITACRALGWEPREVCCIYPGVPLLDPADLRHALALLGDTSNAYVFPVVPFPSPIQRALRRQPDGTTRPLQPEFAATRTQDLEPMFHDAGQFYWGSAQAWLDGLNLHNNGATIVLPEWRVVDIDTPDDWARAEALCEVFSGRPAA